MAEIAKILRTFQPGGKYLKTFPKSIAFSANFSAILLKGAYQIALDLSLNHSFLQCQV